MHASLAWPSARWFWEDSIPQGNDLTGVDVVGGRSYAVGT